MSGIQITPSTLQGHKELDTMLRNLTRDCDRVREFISKEKNDLYRTELTRIFSATVGFADKYDGCTKQVMSSLDFKKDALDVFTLISKQRRGGRKILLVMLSSPTSGLDQQFVSWWPTIRGLEPSTIRLLESFLKQLSAEIAAEAEIAKSLAPLPTLSTSNAEVMMKSKLETDMLKTVREKIGHVTNFEGFSLVTVGDENEFTMTVTMLKNKDDSGVGDNLVPSGHAEVKEELPVPVIAHNPPKSEAARARADPRPEDQDGFWIDTSSEEDEFIQVMMTPKG